MRARCKQQSWARFQGTGRRWQLWCHSWHSQTTNLILFKNCSTTRTEAYKTLCRSKVNSKRVGAVTSAISRTMICSGKKLGHTKGKGEKHSPEQCTKAVDAPRPIADIEQFLSSMTKYNLIIHISVLAFLDSPSSQLALQRNFFYKEQKSLDRSFGFKYVVVPVEFQAHFGL